MPLGPEKGLALNLFFVALLILGILGLFRLFQRVYAPVLRWFLRYKPVFLAIPGVLVITLLFVWFGLVGLFGPLEEASRGVFSGEAEITMLMDQGLLELQEETLVWTASALSLTRRRMKQRLGELGVEDVEDVLADWWWPRLRHMKWVDRASPEESVGDMHLGTRIKWTLAKGWNGLGKEFMPPLDEGSYLLMPTTMPHASIGEALDVLRKQDMAINAIPEVDSAVGKIGRAETPLDPAPISMIETVINYKPQYIIDKDGHRLTFRYDSNRTDVYWNEIVDARGQRVTFPYDPEDTELYRAPGGEGAPAPDGKPYLVRGRFVLDGQGRLIPDPGGKPFRLWRPPLDPTLNPDRKAWAGIREPDDIWKRIVKASEVPGTTSAPRLQPIAARIVMLQSGMRAPMGVKIKGPDLPTIEGVGFQIERLLKEVPSVEPSAVIADRIVGKPYLEIDIDRKAAARYGVPIRRVQDVIETAIGGKKITTTVEGRERYPVRVRYMRELRDQIETLGRVLVPGAGGIQIPMEQLAEIEYVRGPQVIKSEDTFLVGYVLFDMKPGHAEVDVVEEADAYLKAKIDSGEFSLPAGVSYTFAGSYENQVRSEKTLMIVLPLALFVIFLILYFQFSSIPTTLMVFSGIIVAWAGGFIMIWFYAQPWFLDFSLFGVNMQELFQVHPINLSVAIWVGFLALFGIASDNGVVVATYLNQTFEATKPRTVAAIREATVAAALRRVRPALMTTATTILALIPVLTSTGRGSDIMVPMAIPSFGGMTVAIITLFVVPVLYCLVSEVKMKLAVQHGAAWLAGTQAKDTGAGTEERSVE
jgi:Cu(I)/Ag(I) efflux system membrane protein CusA/SilA